MIYLINTSNYIIIPHYITDLKTHMMLLGKEKHKSQPLFTFNNIILLLLEKPIIYKYISIFQLHNTHFTLSRNKHYNTLTIILTRNTTLTNNAV